MANEMRRFVLAPKALDDIESILEWTAKNFGEDARVHYRIRIGQGIQDLTNAEEFSESISRQELGKDLKTYHLFSSRNNIPLKTDRVKEPRHFILYRIRKVGVIEVSRILHDSVDLRRHLPNDVQE